MSIKYAFSVRCKYNSQPYDCQSGVRKTSIYNFWNAFFRRMANVLGKISAGKCKLGLLTNLPHVACIRATEINILTPFYWHFYIVIRLIFSNRIDKFRKRIREELPIFESFEKLFHSYLLLWIRDKIIYQKMLSFFEELIIVGINRPFKGILYVLILLVLKLELTGIQPTAAAEWWWFGGFSKVVATFNHVGGSFNLFKATTGGVWIIPSFRVWIYVLHVEHITCVITNFGQHQWDIPSLFSIAL